MKLSEDRPLMLLSGNSLEQAVLLLAAEYVGVPAVPVSPAYSLQSKDFSKLKGVRELVHPGAVFAQHVAPFERAIGALNCPDAVVIAVNGARQGDRSWSELVATPPSPKRLAAVEAAHGAIAPQATARVLFTSGSTGVPKGVMTTYGNLKALMAYYSYAFGSLSERQPVFLDWMPWHHAFGGVLNFGRSVLLGATHYIDEGRPVPGQFERTVRNLRDVSPTVFNSVPSAWGMLAGELERDPVLAKSLFANVVNFGYGGASLPRDIWQRIQTVAERTVGERIMFCSGLASTETTGGGTHFGWPSDDLGNIGAPKPGSEIKLVPLEGGDGRYEIRVRGAHNFAGYLKRPDLTAAAYDDEKFFRLGDAVRLADPTDPGRGMRFAGRVVEDFKLANGTWVRTGAVRLALVDLCAPLLTDAVICGHDCDFLAALAWPNLAACRKLVPELDGLAAEQLVHHPLLIAALSERLRRQKGSVSLKIERLMLMAEPPSGDANEIADKGYINQAATRERRAELVREVLQAVPATHVALAR
jgi:feruloyl-CoA synthase